MPVRIDLLGTVTPIASVAVKTRIDSEIVGVHFRDGSMVRTGDLLFTMDGRAIEAQIRQFEGQLARDKASLEGAERDLKRYTDLVAKSATPVINLDNAKTQVGVFTGAVKADEASIENLKVQLSYCSIRAPIAGRVSMAAVKVGNFVRQADLTPLATIIQTAPVYVTFALPQRSLSDLRQSTNNETATIEAIVPGDPRRASGQVTMIENTVDINTGTVPVRATMPNADEAAVARHAGDGAVEFPRRDGCHDPEHRRPGQPGRDRSCSSSRTASRPSSRSRSRASSMRTPFLKAVSTGAKPW